VPDEVWEKRLYVARGGSVILHFRRVDSPWGCYAVWFRDWLRAHPDARRRYELTKRELSKQNIGKPDYDDYTRAKTAFLDEVQPAFTAWAQTERQPAIRDRPSAAEPCGHEAENRASSKVAVSGGTGAGLLAVCPARIIHRDRRGRSTRRRLDLSTVVFPQLKD